MGQDGAGEGGSIGPTVRQQGTVRWRPRASFGRCCCVSLFLSGGWRSGRNSSGRIDTTGTALPAKPIPERHGRPPTCPLAPPPPLYKHQHTGTPSLPLPSSPKHPLPLLPPVLQSTPLPRRFKAPPPSPKHPLPPSLPPPPHSFTATTLSHLWEPGEIEAGYGRGSV